MNLIGSLDTPAVKVLSKGIVTSLDNSRPTLGPYGFADAFEDLFMDDPITRNIQTLMWELCHSNLQGAMYAELEPPAMYGKIIVNLPSGYLT